MTHQHHHARPGTTVARGRLALVLAITVAVLVLQLVVGWWTGSLALLADAGHLGSDALGLTLAWVAMSVARRPASDQRTFGFGRTEVLAAGANGLILFAVFGGVVIGAVGRLGEPPEVQAAPVLVVGAVGLMANVAGMRLLRGSARDSINVRGAYLELMADALGSVAVLISAAVIAITGRHVADPIASLVICALILPRTLALLRKVGDVLLESTPRDVDLERVRRHVLGVPGVVDLHDLHVWTITSGMPVMSVHLVVDDAVTSMDRAHEVLDRVSECLAGHFDVAHSTFQIEPICHRDHEVGGHR